MWTVGTPFNNRINYTMGYWDLVAGLYGCRDYATGDRLVHKRVEPDLAYHMGVPFEVETYSWDLHLCQVGYFGSHCEDSSRTQTYAKMCSVLPMVFTVAPQQVSSVSLNSTEPSHTSKSFLQAVEPFASNCASGRERIAVVFHVTGSFTVIMLEGAVHSLRPLGLFSGSSQDNLIITNATNFGTVRAFLRSVPMVEGIYRISSFANTIDAKEVHQKFAVVTKCLITGIDLQRQRRSFPEKFADSISGTDGIVHFDVDIATTSARGGGSGTLKVRVLTTRDTFVLSNSISIRAGVAEVDQILYQSYEAARDDIGAASRGISDEITVATGSQICSKHRAVNSHSASIALRPSALGLCVISSTGASRVDGLGIAVSGRQIRYKVTGMSESISYTYGCDRDWIDIERHVASAEGVYEFDALLRLPDNNHESSFWLVAQASLNRAMVGNAELSDMFGVGLFYYDDNNNTQTTERSTKMMVDAITSGLPSEEMLAGCAETGASLRASCNLVCFTLSGEVFLGGVSEVDRPMLVHHISVAELADEFESEPRDRFGSSRRRILARGPHVHQQQQLTRSLVVRRNHQWTVRVEKLETRTMILAVTVPLGVILIVIVCAMCAGKLSIAIGAKKKKMATRIRRQIPN
jgi:hypothetical protein